MTKKDDILNKLLSHIKRHKLFVLKCPPDRWEKIKPEERGLSAFSIALPHDELSEAKKNALCLVVSTEGTKRDFAIGVISSSAAVTTTESRIKIVQFRRIEPKHLEEIVDALPKSSFQTRFQKILNDGIPSQNLSQKLGEEVFKIICSFENNKSILKSIYIYLFPPESFESAVGQQFDAINTAINSLGFSTEKNLTSMDVVKGKTTALESLRLLEDNVIQHDARQIDGFDLIKSSATGKAVFTKKKQTLEVYTANKNALENCLGVDLIYINLVHMNIVMVQYKMMNKEGDDFIYRPDKQLIEEIKRMKGWQKGILPTSNEYRLNAQPFYLKFVPRDGKIGKRSIVMPLAHYEQWITTPEAKGTKGGVRLSYEALQGQYLRPNALSGLLQAGYIGSPRLTTEKLKKIISDIAKKQRDSRAYVYAISMLDDKSSPLKS